MRSPGLRMSRAFSGMLLTNVPFLLPRSCTVQSSPVGFEREVLAGEAGVFREAQLRGAGAPHREAGAGERYGFHLPIRTLDDEFTRHKEARTFLGIPYYRWRRRETFGAHSVWRRSGVFWSVGGSEILKFCVLASGSSGNAALLATEHTRILVDAGLSMLQLRKRLQAIGESLEGIDAILITHEHSDHVAGLPVMGRNKDVRARIYLTHLTEPAIDWGEARPPRLERFQAGVGIRGRRYRSAELQHSRTTRVDPVGFCFAAQGVRVGVATDLGYVPESIKFHLRRTDVLLLEANHDLDMLKVGPYPWSVKQRVMSRVGHLSNLHMSDYLMQDLDSCTAHLVLGHLSEHNNHPAIVQMMANEALERRCLKTRLSIAAQHAPGEVFQF